MIPAAALGLAGWAAAGLPTAPPGSPAGGPAAAVRGTAGPRRDPPLPRARQRNRALRALLGLTGAYYFAYGPLEPAMPLYAHEVLHAGGAGYGALWSAFGLGALLGLLTVGRLARLRPGIVNAAGTALWGAATLPLVLVGALPAALLVMLAGGLIWGPYGAIETATIQRITPSRRHGTVFGIRRGIQVAATPAGAAAVRPPPRPAPPAGGNRAGRRVLRPGWHPRPAVPAAPPPRLARGLETLRPGSPTGRTADNRLSRGPWPPGMPSSRTSPAAITNSPPMSPATTESAQDQLTLAT